MGDQGRVGVLMGAGCAFVCLFLFVSLALTEVAMQDRRLVSCADALASVGGGNASTGAFFVEGDALEVDEAGVRSRVEEGLAALSDTTCKVGDGVTVSGYLKCAPSAGSWAALKWRPLRSHCGMAPEVRVNGT